MRHLFLARCAAATIDGVAALVLALLLADTLGEYFAARAVIALRIDDPASLWKGPLPFVLGILGNVVYLLPFALMILLLAEPLTGRTPGKAALRLAVGQPAGGSPANSQYWRRFLLKGIAPAGLILGLVAGSWQLLAFSAAAGLLTLLGFLAAAANGGRRAWYDLWAGTEIGHCRSAQR